MVLGQTNEHINCQCFNSDKWCTVLCTFVWHPCYELRRYFISFVTKVRNKCATAVEYKSTIKEFTGNVRRLRRMLCSLLCTHDGE